ncbi:SDR family oxidoreductase [Methylophilus aquaticus]|uniref:SDR family oxidoreductase n=1 Tax=Methylophilus aquaticus TaxID=1971610 RepID=A0ABT9JTY7_9PROT|nr:SDR family oxidoreductase [Methylophilus aquaticus]MDP8568035.1 SDR family oxidoreductase [Methylophilus aquaticus]
MHVQTQLNVMITGANRGIGLEYVRQYAQAGHQLYATVRNPAQATLLKSLSRQYPNIEIHTLNVADIRAIGALAARLESLRLDILVSNAGIYPESSFGQADPAVWLQAFQINTLTTYYLAEAFLPHLARSGHAKLIAMTSKMGSIDDNGSGGEYIYRSTKTALNMVIKSLAIDLRQHNITVAALHPGWVRTDMGGPHGLIDTDTSVHGLRRVIAQLDLPQSGQFIAYDGQEVPW